jgi:hypothetical protein
MLQPGLISGAGRSVSYATGSGTVRRRGVRPLADEIEQDRLDPAGV